MLFIKNIMLSYLKVSSAAVIIDVIVCLFFILPVVVLADDFSISQKTLQSASELDYPPFAIVNPDGTAGGFSVDLLTAVAETAGLSVSFKIGPWQGIKQELADGVLHVLPLVSYSEERAKTYDFTAPYLKLTGTIFVRKGETKIQALSDLRDKEVIVMSGDTAHEYVDRKKLTNTLIQMESYEEAFRLLSSGKHDAIVVQQIVGLQLIKKLGISNIVPVQQQHAISLKPMTLMLEGFEQKFCFAIPKGHPELLSFLNEGLTITYLNGTYDLLYEKWFAPILSKPEIPLRDVINKVLLILVPVLLVITLFGIWYLNRQVMIRTRFLKQEIHQRELTESELQDANRRYRIAQQIGKVGHWLYKIDTKSFWGSVEAKRIFGFDDDLISFDAEEVESCISERERVRRAFIDLIEKDTPYHQEYKILTKDTGERRYILSLAELEKDVAGKPVMVQGIIQDITERKHFETALRESEERFRRAVVDSPIPIMIHDEDGQVLQLSAGWTTYSGYTLEDIPTLADWTKRAYGEQAELSRSYIDDLFNLKHSVSNGVWSVTANDGSIRSWNFQTTPLGETNSGKRVLLSMATDITERIQAEEYLRASEETHRTLVEGLPDIVMRFDRQGRHLFVSENVSTVVDMRADDFIGRTHRQLGFTEEQCVFWKKSIEKVFVEAIPLEQEYSFEGKQGQLINNWRLIPELDANGLVKSVLSFNRDITAQRKAEHNYQTLFREMFEGFALHELICDDKGYPVDYRFLAVNPSFERITGLEAETVVGRTILEILPQTDEFFIENYGRVALSGKPAHFEHYSAELQKYYEIRAFRPAPQQFACVVTDITERRQGEEERSKLQAQLQQAQKMEAIGTLAGGIAHDFNNILGAMIGYAEMVREDSPEGSPAANYLDQVLSAGNRAKALVRQILAFSRRTESNRMPLQPVILVKEAIRLIRSVIPSTVAIEQDLQRDCFLVNADPTQIHQILMNLCTNAFQAMEESGGILTISLREKVVSEKDIGNDSTLRPGNYVQLSISDTGMGISPEIAERIFEPYFSTKETGKGTGMGLAIIHGIVTSYGGFITLESEAGAGTVFHVNLPAWKEDVPAKIQDNGSIPSGTERILLVDDEKLLVDMGKSMLERLGYKVTALTSSIAALSIFQKQPDDFDLVITDQTMPEMTGFDLAGRMLQIRADLPIILCTGYSSQITEEKVMAAGVRGFALKPLAKHDIACLIRNLLKEA